ncbi:hypothetical protein NBE99_01285 [Thermosynechococcus sp. HN-54]|uniref:hypothetical protein n=1 Tax=Thermosynechococcus sp. HN-54 TaxID=2933959 RepID=UPI00202CBC02|nr:hypothetical protein [Thermosynechococcus sp. HN-54]URR35794.1 hypothetical protein NBE99_01285 [Thermosynechococcus sp. HN-54]
MKSRQPCSSVGAWITASMMSSRGWATACCSCGLAAAGTGNYRGGSDRGLE